MSALMPRRALLVAVALVPVAAACTSNSQPEPTSPTTDAADKELLIEVATQEASLIGLYESAIAAFPALAADLTPILDQHREHVAALDPAAASASPGPAPADQTQALATLATAEREAADQRTDSSLRATDEETARLLALIAASEASHAAAVEAVAT